MSAGLGAALAQALTHPVQWPHQREPDLFTAEGVPCGACLDLAEVLAEKNGSDVGEEYLRIIASPDAPCQTAGRPGLSGTEGRATAGPPLGSPHARPAH